MTINKLEENGTITLQLDGWLDTISSPELGAVVDEITEATAIILDFEKVEYIASSGLRQVVACTKKARALNAAFSVINVGTEVMSIFQLTGLDKKIDIKETVPCNNSKSKKLGNAYYCRV